MITITQHFIAAFNAALVEVNPERATIRAIEPDRFSRVTVLALGKAAPAMARGAANVLGDKFERSMVISDHIEAVPEGSRLLIGDHPYPGSASLIAGSEAVAFVTATPPDHEILFLISGGGSALAEVPAEGVTLGDIDTVGRLAMNAGVPIGQLNTVRRHLSAIKNGGLAALAPSAQQLTLAISDVVDGPPSDIASGPTVSDRSNPAQAFEILQEFGLINQVPVSVFDALTSPGPTAIAYKGEIRVIADGPSAAAAAARHLEESGVPVSVLPESLRGNAIEQANHFCDSLSPVVTIMAGETTMKVTGSGQGGRNQSAALAAALKLSRGRPAVFAAMATDGVDGPTDAAGAIVDESTEARIMGAGLDPARHLANDDAYPALAAGDALVRVGPTGTNVSDLWFGWRST